MTLPQADSVTANPAFCYLERVVCVCERESVLNAVTAWISIERGCGVHQRGEMNEGIIFLRLGVASGTKTP